MRLDARYSTCQTVQLPALRPEYTTAAEGGTVAGYMYVCGGGVYITVDWSSLGGVMMMIILI